MKTFSKLFVVLTLLVALLFAVSCSSGSLFPPVTGTEDNGTGNTDGNGGNSDNTQGGDTGDNGDDTPAVDDESQYQDGEFEIRFYLGPNYVIRRFDSGETIVPPTTMEPYKTISCNYVFDGWGDAVFGEATKNAVYQAKYKIEYNYYTATFVMGDYTVEEQVVCQSMPTMPDPIEIEGAEFVCWDKEPEMSTADTTYTAVYTTLFGAEQFRASFESGLLIYPSGINTADNGNSTTANAINLLCLLMEENVNPQEPVAARIVEHLTACVQKDQAPEFDACCFWSYAPHTASIAMAKQLPSVWNKLGMDTQLRLNTMMKAFAYLESFATSDSNNYGTGPGLDGNFGKGWNPNYRLANIPVMVYVTHYFGNGDMDVGAETVNAMLKAFDEDEYTNIVNTFQKYGWRRALKTWTQEARTSTDGKGTVGRSSKDLLISGGQAVGEDTPTDSDLWVALGTGAGVGNGGKDYTYNGYALNEAEGIIRSLLMQNYGTGDLRKNAEYRSTFLQVASDHWYDKDGDGVKELVAWIVDGSLSPYHGQYGMMKEFASGNRSSTGYCSHDFVLATSMVYACKILGIYDLEADTYVDSNGVSIQDAIQVGNDDFLYKNEIGYQGYATGSYGESTKAHSESNEGSSYFAIKSLWQKTLKPLITVAEDDAPAGE